MRTLLDPDTVPGALVYGALLLLSAGLVARAIRSGVNRFLARTDYLPIDRTGVIFTAQLVQGLVYLIAMVLYAHLVPVLRQVGTALLTGVSIASVVVGLAAQSTLGNVIAGFAILIYHPIRIGDRVQIAAPPGPMVGTVETLSLGYTTIRADDGQKIIVPNSTMASQVTVKLSESVSSPAIGIGSTTT